MIKPYISWLAEEDKIKHVIISGILIIIFTSILPVWLAIFITLLIGTGKELLDLFYYRSGFSWLDMAANVIGCLAGLSLYFILPFSR